MMLLVSVYHV